MRWFEAVALLGFVLIKRNEALATTAFGGAGAVPFVRQKVFQASDEERTKFPVVRRKLSEMVLREKSGEELLSKVLRVRRVEPLSAYESIKRIPISAAKIGERALGAGCVIARRQLHHAPMGRREDVCLGWRRGRHCHDHISARGAGEGCYARDIDTRKRLKLSPHLPDTSLSNERLFAVLRFEGSALHDY